jgi:hypothetical protein
VAFGNRFAPAWDSSTTSWCSSTSLRSVFNSRFAAFKRCYAALKDLTSFDLQSQDMHVLMGDFFFVHCKAVLEFLIAEGV